MDQTEEMRRLLWPYTIALFPENSFDGWVDQMRRLMQPPRKVILENQTQLMRAILYNVIQLFQQPNFLKNLDQMDPYPFLDNLRRILENRKPSENVELDPQIRGEMLRIWTENRGKVDPATENFFLEELFRIQQKDTSPFFSDLMGGLLAALKLRSGRNQGPSSGREETQLTTQRSPTPASLGQGVDPNQPLLYPGSVPNQLSNLSSVSSPEVVNLRLFQQREQGSGAAPAPAQVSNPPGIGLLVPTSLSNLSGGEAAGGSASSPFQEAQSQPALSPKLSGLLEQAKISLEEWNNMTQEDRDNLELAMTLSLQEEDTIREQFPSSSPTPPRRTAQEKGKQREEPSVPEQGRGQERRLDRGQQEVRDRLLADANLDMEEAEARAREIGMGIQEYLEARRIEESLFQGRTKAAAEEPKGKRRMETQGSPDVGSEGVFTEAQRGSPSSEEEIYSTNQGDVPIPTGPSHVLTPSKPPTAKRRRVQEGALLGRNQQNHLVNTIFKIYQALRRKHQIDEAKTSFERPFRSGFLEGCSSCSDEELVIPDQPLYIALMNMLQETPNLREVDLPDLLSDFIEQYPAFFVPAPSLQARLDLADFLFSYILKREEASDAGRPLGFLVSSLRLGSKENVEMVHAHCQLTQFEPGREVVQVMERLIIPKNFGLLGPQLNQVFLNQSSQIPICLRSSINPGVPVPETLGLIHPDRLSWMDMTTIGSWRFQRGTPVMYFTFMSVNMTEQQMIHEERPLEQVYRDPIYPFFGYVVDYSPFSFDQQKAQVTTSVFREPPKYLLVQPRSNVHNLVMVAHELIFPLGSDIDRKYLLDSIRRKAFFPQPFNLSMDAFDPLAPEVEGTWRNLAPPLVPLKSLSNPAPLYGSSFRSPRNKGYEQKLGGEDPAATLNRSYGLLFTPSPPVSYNFFDMLLRLSNALSISLQLPTQKLFYLGLCLSLVGKNLVVNPKQAGELVGSVPTLIADYKQKETEKNQGLTQDPPLLSLPPQALQLPEYLISRNNPGLWDSLRQLGSFYRDHLVNLQNLDYTVITKKVKIFLFPYFMTEFMVLQDEGQSLAQTNEEITNLTKILVSYSYGLIVRNSDATYVTNVLYPPSLPNPGQMQEGAQLPFSFLEPAKMKENLRGLSLGGIVSRIANPVEIASQDLLRRKFPASIKPAIEPLEGEELDQEILQNLFLEEEVVNPLRYIPTLRLKLADKQFAYSPEQGTFQSFRGGPEQFNPRTAPLLYQLPAKLSLEELTRLLPNLAKNKLATITEKGNTYHLFDERNVTKLLRTLEDHLFFLTKYVLPKPDGTTASILVIFPESIKTLSSLQNYLLSLPPKDNPQKSDEAYLTGLEARAYFDLKQITAEERVLLLDRLKNKGKSMETNIGNVQGTAGDLLVRRGVRRTAPEGSQLAKTAPVPGQTSGAGPSNRPVPAPSSASPPIQEVSTPVTSTSEELRRLLQGFFTSGNLSTRVNGIYPTYVLEAPREATPDTVTLYVLPIPVSTQQDLQNYLGEGYQRTQSFNPAQFPEKAISVVLRREQLQRLVDEKRLVPAPDFEIRVSTVPGVLFNTYLLRP